MWSLAPVCCIAIAAVSWSQVVYAQSICDIVLTTKAFNTRDYTMAASQSLQVLDDACSKEYDSQTEAHSAGKAAGGSVGWGGYSLGYNEAKSEATGKYSIRESQLCTSRRQQIASSVSESERATNANYAVAAWEKCALLSDQLYIKYKERLDGKGMSGHIIRNPGKAFGEMRGISGAGGSQVTCKIDGVAYQLNETPAKGVPFTKKETAIVCTKNPDESVELTILTTVGDPPFVELRSFKDRRDADIKALEDELVRTKNDLEAKIAALSKDKISKRSPIALRAHTGDYLGVTGKATGEQMIVNIGVAGLPPRGKNQGSKSSHERFIIESHDE
jgi:hypothetical protein